MSQSLHKVTFDDIQNILNQTVERMLGDKIGSGILFFDVSYLYNFQISDMRYVSKVCKLGRYDVKFAKLWHADLERWYNDQTVRDDFGRPIRPLQLRRNMDRIVNEGLEMVAQCLTGGQGISFNFHAIGEGDDPNAIPSDTQLVDQLSRIDVTKNPDGGSTSRDGTTIYMTGNHPADIQSADITETGIFSTATSSNDMMLDHSVFDPPIVHDQFEDSAGSSTVIYMCGI